MQPDNPFAPPKQSMSPNPVTNSNEEGVVMTPRSLEYLSNTRGWIQAFSVIIFMCTAIHCIVFVMGLSKAKSINFGEFILNILIFAIYIYIAIFLIKYKNSIGKFLFSREPADVEKSVATNLLFWLVLTVASVVVLFVILISTISLI